MSGTTVNGAGRKLRAFGPGTGRMSGRAVAAAIVVVAIAIIPLLYVTMLTTAYLDPLSRLDQVPAAVVDLDTPATATDPEGTTKTVQVGADLTEKLVHPEPGTDTGFGWTAMGAAEAEDALRTQKVRAILTVPAGTSEAVAKLADTANPTTDTSVPKLSLRTDDGINYLTGTIAGPVAEQVQTSLRGEISRTYVDAVLAGLGSARSGLQDAADGAGRLTDGAGSLATGLTTLDDGAGKAATGANELATGASTAADAARRARDGASALATGAGTLDAGASELATGTHTLADGAGQLSTGAGTLAQGVDRYTQGVDSAAAGADKLAAGAAGLTTLAQGVDTYTQGVDTAAKAVSDGEGTLKAGADALATGAGQVATGADALSAGLGAADAAADPKATQLVPGLAAASAGLTQLDQNLSAPEAAAALTALGQGATSVDQGVASYTTSVGQLKDACVAAHGAADPICQGLAQLDTNSATLAGGAHQVSGGVATLTGQIGTTRDAVSRLDTAATALLQGARTAAGGASSLATGAHQVSDGAGTLAQGVDTLAQGLDTLSGNSAALRDGASRATALTDGAQQLGAGLDTLAGNSADLRDGAGRLAGGASAAVDGIGRLVTGADTLAGGTSQLSTGADALATGSGTLADGIGQLDTGASRLATGTQALADGADSARTGAQQLADGAGTLHDGLADGVQKLPDMTDVQVSATAERATHPVDVVAERDHAVENSGAGFMPMFLSLALWVGAIAMFMVVPALDRHPGDGRRWWLAAGRPAVRTALMSAAQAALVVVFLAVMTHVTGDRLLELVLLSVAASWTFTVLNHALIAAFGYRGRFVSIIFLVFNIAAMGATYPIETTPDFLRVLHPWLPMSHTQLAFRALIAGRGADGSVTTALWVLLAYFAAGLLMTAVAARLRTGYRLLPTDNALLGDQVIADAERRVQREQDRLEELRTLRRERASATIRP